MRVLTKAQQDSLAALRADKDGWGVTQSRDALAILDQLLVVADQGTIAALSASQLTALAALRKDPDGKLNKTQSASAIALIDALLGVTERLTVLSPPVVIDEPEPAPPPVVPPVTTDPNAPAGYTFAAREGQSFTLANETRVAYGANGVFNYARKSGLVQCTNDVFGDPIYGVEKACYVEGPNAPAPVITVTVSPASVKLAAGRTQQFTANVPVVWTATGGSIDANGLFTQGAVVGNYKVRATSKDDPTKYAEASVGYPTVTVNPGGGGSGDDIGPFSHDGWNPALASWSESWEYADGAALFASAHHDSSQNDDNAPFWEIDEGGFFGENALRHVWPDNSADPHSDFGTSCRLDVLGSSDPEIWIETFIKYSANWDINGPAAGGVSFKEVILHTIAGSYGMRTEHASTDYMTLVAVEGEEFWPEVPGFLPDTLDTTEWRRLRMRMKIPTNATSADGELEYWVTERDGTTTHNRLRDEQDAASAGVENSDWPHILILNANMNKDSKHLQYSYFGRTTVWHTDPTAA